MKRSIRLMAHRASRGAFTSGGGGGVGSTLFSATMRNESNATSWAEGAASFPLMMQRGELPAGQGLQATIDGTPQWAQVDVHNTWSDGSAKMALVTLRRPTMAAGASKTVAFAVGTPPGQTPIDVMALIGARTISLALTGITAGGNSQADLTVDIKAAVGAAIASPVSDPTIPTYWIRGPNATTVCVAISNIAGATVFNASAARLLFDVTVDYAGTIHVSYELSNDRVFEASPTSSKGEFRAAHALTIDGSQRLAHTGAVWLPLGKSAHYDALQASAPPIWMGGPSNLNVVRPEARLQAARAIAPYDTALEFSESTLASIQAAIDADADWLRPLHMNTWPAGVGIGTDYGSGGGGFSENQALLPPSAVRAIRTGDIRAVREMFGHCETAHSLPIRYWDATRNRWLDRSHYDRISRYENGATGDPGNTASIGLNIALPNYAATVATTGTPGGYVFSFDDQHIPSSVPTAAFFFSGQAHHYRNVMAMAATAIFVTNRNDANHDPFYTSRYDILYHTNSGPGTTYGPDAYKGWHATRTIAWVFVALDNGAFFARGGSHYASYFKTVLDTNLDAHNRALPNIKLDQGGSDPDALQGMDQVCYPFTGGGKTYPMWQHSYLLMTEAQILLRRLHDDPTLAQAPTQHAREAWEYHAGLNRSLLSGKGGLDWRNALGGALPMVREWDGLGSGGWGTAYSAPEPWYQQRESRIPTCTELAAVIDTWPQPVAGDSNFTGGILDYSDAAYNANQFDFAHTAHGFGQAGLCYRVHTILGNTAAAADFLAGYNLAVAQTPQFASTGAKLSSILGLGGMWGWTLGDQSVAPWTNEHYGRGSALPAAATLTDPGTIPTAAVGAANGTRVIRFAGTNAYGFEITTQSVANALRIDPTSGWLMAGAAWAGLTHPTTVTFSVRALGDGGNSAPLAKSIATNDGTPIMSALTFSFVEHAPTATVPRTVTPGQRIGDLSMVSPTTVTSVVLSGANAGAFSVGTPASAGGGAWQAELRVGTDAGDPALFDHETTPQMTVSAAGVNATGTGAAAVQTVNITNQPGEPGEPEPMALDETTLGAGATVVAAFGTMKLLTTATNLVNVVVRGSAAAGTDIQAASGTIRADTAAIMGAIGANEGVIRVYNQVNGALLSQVLAERPSVTTAGGAIIALPGVSGSVPAIVGGSNFGWIVTPEIAWTAPGMALLIVASDATGDGTVMEAMGADRFSNQGILMKTYSGSGGLLFASRWGNNLTQPIVAGRTSVWVIHDTGTTLTFRRNGVQVATLSTSGFGPFANPLRFAVGAEFNGVGRPSSMHWCAAALISGASVAGMDAAAAKLMTQVGIS